MAFKFSQDVVPLTDLKINPGKVIRRATEAGQPVLLTRRGRGVAVVQGLSEYERDQEERAFMRAVMEGLLDLEAGRETDIEGVRKRLALD